MSLRLRLNLLHAALLAIALGSIIAAMLFDAGPRARAEYDSMMQLARSHVERSLSSLRAAPDPQAGLKALLADLDHLRHIRIGWQSAAGDQVVADRAPGSREALRISVDIPGTPRGDVVIAAAPGDEVAEIWETVSAIAFRGMILAIALFGLSSLLIQYSLGSIKAIGDGLASLGAGDFAARVPVKGPPELSTICGALNGLAEVLEQSLEENRRLAREMVGARDRERRELAHELHDEMGPCLFSARANGAALLQAIGSASLNGARIKQLGTAILVQIERIQNVNRRVLTQLSPPGLKELGIVLALQALVDTWQAQCADLRIDIDVGAAAGGLGEAEALTVYRIVQEGLTNALRHGGAETVSVVVKDEQISVAGKPSEEAVVVRILDNGRGLDPKGKPGFGMLGMQERLWALGGTVELVERPEGGTRLEARIPFQSSTATSPAAQHPAA